MAPDRQIDASAPRSARLPAPAGRLRPALSALALTASLAILGGCATLFEPVNQEVALRPLVDDRRTEASCELSNDKGRWTVQAPADLAVTRSSAPLLVECRTDDGLVATQRFENLGSGNPALAGSNVGSGYPFRLEMQLALPDPSQQRGYLTSAASVNPAQLPYVDEAGQAGYGRFLAGELPRAFAISNRGHWIRVNGSRSASRTAMERCLALGGLCSLYAVDHGVVWEDPAVARVASSR